MYQSQVPYSTASKSSDLLSPLIFVVLARILWLTSLLDQLCDPRCQLYSLPRPEFQNLDRSGGLSNIIATETSVAS